MAGNEQKKIKATQIFEKYYSTMVHTAKFYFRDNETAEDIVSESMVSIIQILDKISVVDSPQTRAYILTTVRNTSLNMIKKRKHMKEDGEETLDGIPDDSDSALDGIISSENYETILNTVSALPKKLSDVLYLSAVMGHSNLEIADELGISYDSVRKDLSRARKKISERLGRLGISYPARQSKREDDSHGK